VLLSGRRHNRSKNGVTGVKNKWVILADDFTGANDTGVQFSKQGLQTVVMTDLMKIGEGIAAAEVLVVDTESRFDSWEDAFKKYQQVAEVLKKNGQGYVYKKIDSTFRGNISAEIAGMMDVLDMKTAIIAAALPSNGRVIRDGNVYVHEQLLHTTEVAGDPRTPVTTSSIAELLNDLRRFKMHHVDVHSIEKGPESLSVCLRQLQEAGKGIIILDTAKDSHLEIIAHAVALLPSQPLLVGSSGLAAFLPQAYGLLKECDAPKRVLAVCGSVSGISQRQVDKAAKNMDNLTVIDLNITSFFQDDERERQRIVEKVSVAFGKGNHVVIRSAESRERVDEAVECGRDQGISATEVSEQIAGFLGKVTAESIAGHKFGGLILTGGDVAIHVMKSINAVGAVIENEILPGIPYGQMIHPDYQHMTLVTKAGAFGDEDAMIRIVDFLERRNTR